MSSQQGRAALVTGAASGIGLGCSRELAARGYALALVDRDAERLGAAARELAARGARVSTFVVDLSDKGAVAKLAQEAWDALSGVDLLLNNAGVMYFGPLAKMTLVDWEWVVDVNFWAPIRLTSALLPRMRERGHGHVAVTASAAGMFPFPSFTAYSVTKAAMIAYCEALRAEVHGEGIDVSVICPSLVSTNLAKGGRFGSEGDRQSAHAQFRSGSGMSVEVASRRIVDALIRRKPYVMVGGMARPLWWLDRASPELSHFIRVQMFRQFERMRNTAGGAARQGD